MEIDDIYGDLPSYSIGEDIDKLHIENKKLQTHIKSLEHDIEGLRTTIKQLKSTQTNLARNISELFKTAKCEIDRKDRLVSELRAKLDQLSRKKGCKAEGSHSSVTSQESGGTYRQEKNKNHITNPINRNNNCNSSANLINDNNQRSASVHSNDRGSENINKSRKSESDGSSKRHRNDDGRDSLGSVEIGGDCKRSRFERASDFGGSSEGYKKRTYNTTHEGEYRRWCTRKNEVERGGRRGEKFYGKRMEQPSGRRHYNEDDGYDRGFGYHHAIKPTIKEEEKRRLEEEMNKEKRRSEEKVEKSQKEEKKKAIEQNTKYSESDVITKPPLKSPKTPIPTQKIDKEDGELTGEDTSDTTPQLQKITENQGSPPLKSTPYFPPVRKVHNIYTQRQAEKMERSKNKVALPIKPPVNQQTTTEEKIDPEPTLNSNLDSLSDHDDDFKLELYDEKESSREGGGEEDKNVKNSQEIVEQNPKYNNETQEECLETVVKTKAAENSKQDLPSSTFPPPPPLPPQSSSLPANTDNNNDTSKSASRKVVPSIDTIGMNISHEGIFYPVLHISDVETESRSSNILSLFNEGLSEVNRCEEKERVEEKNVSSSSSIDRNFKNFSSNVTPSVECNEKIDLLSDLNTSSFEVSIGECGEENISGKIIKERGEERSEKCYDDANQSFSSQSSAIDFQTQAKSTPQVNTNCNNSVSLQQSGQKKRRRRCVLLARVD